MTEPAQFDEKVTPFVILSGKRWPIPELGVRQLRLVRRPLIDITNAIKEVPADPETLALDPRAPPKQTVGDRLISLSADLYDQMTDVVYQGLTRAHPDMKRDEFLDMSCTDSEIYLAFLIVRRQSNVFMRAESTAPAAAPPTGEAQADASQTGTE